MRDFVIQKSLIELYKLSLYHLNERIHLVHILSAPDFCDGLFILQQGCQVAQRANMRIVI